MPPAPPTFSTTTCWPRISLMRCRHDAAEHVGRAAGGERNDHGDRTGRIVLGVGGAVSAKRPPNTAAIIRCSIVLYLSPGGRRLASALPVRSSGAFRRSCRRGMKPQPARGFHAADPRRHRRPRRHRTRPSRGGSADGLPGTDARLRRRARPRQGAGLARRRRTSTVRWSSSRSSPSTPISRSNARRPRCSSRSAGRCWRPASR